MGRRRRNAYWTLAGGQVTVEEVNQSNDQEEMEMEEPTQASEPEPPEEKPVINTRRSLRQQAKKAAQTIHEIQQEEELVDIELSDEEEDLARFTPLNTGPRRKRFLKDGHRPAGRPPGSGAERKARVVPETTAQVLNRLLGKRTNKPGFVVKHGRFNAQRGRPAGGGKGAHAKNIPPPPPLQPQPPPRRSAGSPVGIRIPQPMGSFGTGSLPLKVEIQEGYSSVVTTDGPKKRGRKRKVDMPVNLSMKNEAGELITPAPPRKHHQQHHRLHKRQTQDPDWDPSSESIDEEQQQQQRKRGRQSAATAIVKNRFPFCSLCLSKNPPSDYIINHMSCPTEYQRMKRLFTYIYKDLRFPFMPFDMERENVFDYCDLPLCDCCIQLYREIYDSYAQIETARDELKSKIERMVYQIQLSEQNPAVAQQLTSIKNSPDALMNKYCNFRRRFATYKPGDSRGDVEGACLVPATIARIRVINQAPKRTAGTQTFLTAGHFPPPQPAQEQTPPATNTTGATSASNTSTAAASSSGSVGTVVVKKEVDPDPPTSSSSQKGSKSDSGSSARLTKDQQTPQKQLPKPKPTPSTSTSSSKPVVTTTSKPSVPISKPDRPVPAPHASALTIVKTSGGGGPAIIRKVPQKPANSIISQHSRLLAIATPTHKRPNPTTTSKPTVNGSTSKPSESTKELSQVVVKDEPVDPDVIQDPAEQESDPFFTNDLSSGTSEKDTGKSESASENSAPQTHYKHKKLRVLPVPSYKDSSNDSSDNATSNDQDSATDKGQKSNNESENDLTNDATENQEQEKELANETGTKTLESTTTPTVSQDDSKSTSETVQEDDAK